MATELTSQSGQCQSESISICSSPSSSGSPPREAGHSKDAQISNLVTNHPSNYSPLARDRPTTSLPMDAEGACNESQAHTPAACPGSDHVSILEDKENREPALKEFRGTRFTITVHWGSEKLKYTKNIDNETENDQVEVSFTPKPPAKRITFALEFSRLKGSQQQTTQSHDKGYPPKYYNTAFYGLKGGSPAFGHRYTDPPKDSLSPTIPTVPNSPAVRNQPLVVHDSAVNGLYQTSVDNNKPDIQGQQGTQLGGFKRQRSLEDVYKADLKPQRLSDSDNEHIN
ncbi:hypothetical protein V8F06_008886 [Rhypophila decipiens]